MAVIGKSKIIDSPKGDGNDCVSHNIHLSFLCKIIDSPKGDGNQL